MCPPGYRTLTSTAGPRIKKTSCCGCSERKSTWLPPGGLCPRFRWYPCDTPAPAHWGQATSGCCSGRHSSSWGWLAAFTAVCFQSLPRGPPTPENLFCSLFFLLRPPQTLSLGWRRGCSAFPASYPHCLFLRTVWHCLARRSYKWPHVNDHQHPPIAYGYFYVLARCLCGLGPKGFMYK